MKKTNSRLIKINEEIKREISLIIFNRLKDPRINVMTTVVRVDTTPDLKYCKVYVSVLGNKDEVKETITALKNSAGFVRSELAHIINLRNTPEIKFVEDDSIEYGINISKKLDELMSVIPKDDGNGQDN